MASPNSDFTEIVTTTLRNRRKKLADNVTNHNALLRKLSERGRVQMTSGGRTLVEELEYAENSTFMYYSGYEVIDISPSDVMSAAEYQWKQAAVTVTISGLEMRQNSGPNALIDLAGARMRNAEKTMKNQLSTGVYSDGTGTGGKQIGGLQLLIADDPTSGTIGGIAASNSFWQNSEYDFSDDSATASSTTIQNAMHKLWLETLRGSDHTDLIVADSVYFNHYWNSLTDIQRITTAKDAEAGYQTLAFNGPGGRAMVEYDDTCPASRMYFVNSDYLKFRVHPDAWMEPLTKRESVNQDAFVMPIIFMGNLTCSNRELQGVMQP